MLLLQLLPGCHQRWYGWCRCSGEAAPWLLLRLPQLQSQQQQQMSARLLPPLLHLPHLQRLLELTRARHTKARPEPVADSGNSNSRPAEMRGQAAQTWTQREA